MVINGKGECKLWNKAAVISDFSSPWNKEEINKTEFKSLWDSVNFYFLFKIFDTDIHIVKTDNSNQSINDSDRVELFFRLNEKLTPYYCLEIDPTSRLMDFKALPNKNFDFNWHWSKEDILIQSDIQQFYFTVEGCISIKSLDALNLINHGVIETGMFRAKYQETIASNFEPTWITWVNPKTATPNFHTPSSFGAFKLMNY